MDKRQRLLIVDRSDDTCEVLRTALSGRGIDVLAARQSGRGLELARQHRPDLIVLDLEVDDDGAESEAAPFAEEAARLDTHLVVLGTLRRQQQQQLGGEFLAKPYHYGGLIRKIEELLDTSPRAVAPCS